MSVIKKLAGETVYYGISSILGRILHFVILTPFYTDIFPKEDYGLVTILFTYSAILMVFFSFRMETTFFRYGSDEGNFTKSFSTASLFLFFSTLLFSIPIWCFSDDIAALFGLAGQAYYIKLIVLIISFDTLAAIPFAKLRLKNRPKKFAALKILNVLINLFFVLLFLWYIPNYGSAGMQSMQQSMNLDGSGIVFVFWSGMIASTLIFLFLLMEYRGIQLKFDLALWKKMLKYTFPLVLVGLCSVFNKEAGYLLLEYLSLGSAEENYSVVGIFSANVKLAVIMSLFTQAYNYAVEPFFFNNKNKSGNKQLYADSALLYIIVTSLAFVGIMALLPILKLIIRNEEMYVGLGVVPYMLFAFILLGIYYNLSVWFKLTDRTIYASYIAVAGAVVTAVVAVITIPMFSYYGVAYAALACYLLMIGLSYFFGKRFYPIPYDVKGALFYLATALLLNYVRTFIVDILSPNLFAELAIGIATALAFIAMVFLKERAFLKRILGK